MDPAPQQSACDVRVAKTPASAIGHTPVYLRFWRLRDAVNKRIRSMSIEPQLGKCNLLPDLVLRAMANGEGSRGGGFITSKVNRAELMSQIDKILGNAFTMRGERLSCPLEKISSSSQEKALLLKHFVPAVGARKIDLSRKR